MWLAVSITWGQGANEIYYATSPDGYRFQMVGPAINMTGAPWGIYLLMNPFVLASPNGYEMYFVAGNNTSHPIWHAHSPDGLNWTVGSEILAPGPPGSWDDGFVGHPWVVSNGSANLLYYIGWSDRGGTYTSGMGVAVLDGYDHLDHRVGTEPVLGAGPTGSWDAGGITAFTFASGVYPTVYYLTALWSNPDQRIGTARSADGISWVRSADSGTPVLPDPNYSGESLVSLVYVSTEFGPRIYYFSSALPIWFGVLVPATTQVPGPPNPYCLPILTTAFAALVVIAVDAARESRPGRPRSREEE